MTSQNNMLLLVIVSQFVHRLFNNNLHFSRLFLLTSISAAALNEACKYLCQGKAVYSIPVWFKFKNVSHFTEKQIQQQDENVHYTIATGCLHAELSNLELPVLLPSYESFHTKSRAKSKAIDFCAHYTCAYYTAIFSDRADALH